MKTFLAIFSAIVVVFVATAQTTNPPPANVPVAAPTKVPAPPSIAPPVPVPLSKMTLEKIAKMTPIFDGKTLDGWIQMPPAAISFAREDVVDLAGLVKRLTEKTDPVAAWLSAELDEAGRTGLGAFAPDNPNAMKETAQPLVSTINRLVKGETPVYDEARFRGVGLRAETEALLRRKPEGLELMRLNRMLFEDAFPRQLVKSAPAAWVVKDGAMASTGAGRGGIYTEKEYTHFRLIFQVRQISGNHVPGVLIFGQPPAPTDRDLGGFGAIQFQVPNGGHWDYRPGVNKAGEHFTRPVRIRFDLKEWAQVEMLVNAGTGVARMAVAQPVGARGTENLVFNHPPAGRPGPIVWQMHNAGLFDEFKDVRIEIDPKEDRLITVE